MVKYLRDGQDFSFPSDFGFTQSASRKGGSMPDTNRAEAVRVRSGTNFEARDPEDMNVSDRSYRRMEDAEIAREPKAKGGRIKRAIGGVIPGPAPAAGMQPMTAPPSAAPMMGNPLSHVQVTMPASELALMAKGAAKIGAGQAVGGLAQAARNRTGAQPVRMPGAAAIAPAAAAPPPTGALQSMPGTRPIGMKKGGHLTAKARHALPASDFALPGERYPIEDKNHARNALARVSQHGSSSEQSRVRSAVHRKFPDIGKKG